MGHSFLDFNKFGALFSENPKHLTVEAWIYPTLSPEKESLATVLQQQVSISLMSYDSTDPLCRQIKESDGWNDDDYLLIMSLNFSGGGNSGFATITLSPYQWHHIVFQVQEDQIVSICDKILKSFPLFVGWAIQMDNFAPQKDFVLGGYGNKIDHLGCIILKPAIGSFAGYIDEVRFSTIPRYDIKGQLIPQGRFEPDADTIALWHFDEQPGTEIFHDSSGNKYDLMGKNGTTTGPLAVNGFGKLANTWGWIKNK